MAARRYTAGLHRIYGPGPNAGARHIGGSGTQPVRLHAQGPGGEELLSAKLPVSEHELLLASSVGTARFLDNALFVAGGGHQSFSQPPPGLSFIVVAKSIENSQQLTPS